MAASLATRYLRMRRARARLILNRHGRLAGYQSSFSLRRIARALYGSVNGLRWALLARRIPSPPSMLGQPEAGDQDAPWISRNSPTASRDSSSRRRRLPCAKGNPQITPEHLLKVLLDDPEGLAAGLIARAGGNPKQALEQDRGRARQAAQGVGRRAPRSRIWPPRSPACSTRPSRWRPRPATASSPSSACSRRSP